MDGDEIKTDGDVTTDAPVEVPMEGEEMAPAEMPAEGEAAV